MLNKELLLPPPTLTNKIQLPPYLTGASYYSDGDTYIDNKTSNIIFYFGSFESPKLVGKNTLQSVDSFLRYPNTQLIADVNQIYGLEIPLNTWIIGAVMLNSTIASCTLQQSYIYTFQIYQLPMVALNISYCLVGITSISGGVPGPNDVPGVKIKIENI